MNLSFTAEQIAAVVGGEIRGNKQAAVHDLAKIETAEEGTLCFLSDPKFLPYLTETKASIVLMSKNIAFEGTTGATLIVVDNARGAMAQLLGLVQEVLQPKHKGVEQPCFIAEGVEIPEDAYIGAFAYIAKGAKIGAGAQIYPQCYVGENVKIGDRTTLYSGVKIYYNCAVGQDCILHSGCVIGADGFGFEPDAQGVLQKVPQIGNVVIEDDVEIGANTTIDRAVMGESRIKTNTKLDNLVQIGHNVVVGKSNIMCAQVGVAGSTNIGDHCVFAGQAGLAGHLTITDNCIIGAQSGVPSDIKQPGMYMGSPIIDAMRWRRAIAAFKNLPEMTRIVNKLEKQYLNENK